MVKNTKKKKKLTIDVYDPQIYTRLLWVCKNATLKDLQKRFVLRDNVEIDEEWDPQEGVFTLYVKEKSTGKLGCLVNFADFAFSEKNTLINVVAHEAEHVKCSIFKDMHIISNYDSEEADAYLVGWCAQCIYDTIKK